MLLAATLALHLTATALMSLIFLRRRGVDRSSPPDRPSPMPDNPPAGNLIDILAAMKSADSNLSAANAAYVAAQTVMVSANAAMKSAIDKHGEIYTIDATSGIVEVYISDTASVSGFRSFFPVNAATTAMVAGPIPAPLPLDSDSTTP